MMVEDFRRCAACCLLSGGCITTWPAVLTCPAVCCFTAPHPNGLFATRRRLPCAARMLRPRVHCPLHPGLQAAAH